MLRTDTFPPNKAMTIAAQRGIDLRKGFGRGGTSVGMGTARSLINGTDLDLTKIKQMYAFFVRHESDKRPYWDDPNDPTNGYIAWLLWGGDAGKKWSSGIRDRALEAGVWFAQTQIR